MLHTVAMAPTDFNQPWCLAPTGRFRSACHGTIISHTFLTNSRQTDDALPGNMIFGSTQPCSLPCRHLAVTDANSMISCENAGGKVWFWPTLVVKKKKKKETLLNVIIIKLNYCYAKKVALSTTDHHNTRQDLYELLKLQSPLLFVLGIFKKKFAKLSQSP